MSAEGTFVRAYTESFELAFEEQSTEWGYPGFVDASPKGIDEQVTEVVSNSATRKVVNTVFYRPLRRVDNGATSRLILCRSESQSIEQRSPSSDSEWRKIGKPWGYPVAIEFTRSANGSPPPPRKSNRVPGGLLRIPCSEIGGSPTTTDSVSDPRTGPISWRAMPFPRTRICPRWVSRRDRNPGRLCLHPPGGRPTESETPGRFRPHRPSRPTLVHHVHRW